MGTSDRYLETAKACRPLLRPLTEHHTTSHIYFQVGWPHNFEFLWFQHCLDPLSSFLALAQGANPCNPDVALLYIFEHCYTAITCTSRIFLVSCLYPFAHSISLNFGLVHCPSIFRHTRVNPCKFQLSLARNIIVTCTLWTHIHCWTSSSLRTLCTVCTL